MAFTWSNTIKSSDATITNNGKTVSITGGWAVSQESMTTGKYYFEFIINTYSQIVIGISQNTSIKPLDNQIRAVYGYDGNKVFPRAPYSTAYNSTNIIGIAIDMDEGEISFTKDGVNLGVAFNNLKELSSIQLYMSTTTNGGRESLTIVDDISKMKYPQIAKEFLYDSYLILQNEKTNNCYSLSDKTLIHLPDASNESIISLGIPKNKIVDLEGKFDKHIYASYSQSGELETREEIVEPFSVYDYISEFPEVLIHTESPDDIIVSTATAPFSIYDELKDEVEVLYYTDNKNATNANLTLEANWSPIDELDGNFEVVTWTDEQDASRQLNMIATPSPKFVYPLEVTNVKNGIAKLSSQDLSIYTAASKVKYLLSPDNSQWFTWTNGSFVRVELNDNNIIAYGMTSDTLNKLTEEQLMMWAFNNINIGVFLADGIRGNTISKVANTSISSSVYKETPIVEKANFYILNTTATIDIDMSGLTIVGKVDDADMTRVQYRVRLNGRPYYPANGDFTPLSAPPLNINLTLRSEDVVIGDWNDIEVEFQDSFGSSDTWKAQFIGKYAGLMFMDDKGEYYSTDVGQVLKYLDFGTVLTGQVTPSYEVKIKNEYGFDVKNARLKVNTKNFAEGMSVQLANHNRDFGETELPISDLANGAETTFFIRMVSQHSTVPNANKTFDIVVLAERTI